MSLPASTQLTGLRLLVVDDVEAIRTLVAKLLSAMGCENVYTAPDAETAWRHLERVPFDALLLDYELPGENGLDFARRLRGSLHMPNRSVPVLLLTGYADIAMSEGYLRAGIDAHLVKPVMPDRLGQRIRAAIEERAAKPALADAPPRRRARRA